MLRDHHMSCWLWSPWTTFGLCCPWTTSGYWLYELIKFIEVIANLLFKYSTWCPYKLNNWCSTKNTSSNSSAQEECSRMCPDPGTFLSPQLCPTLKASTNSWEALLQDLDSEADCLSKLDSFVVAPFWIINQTARTKDELRNLASVVATLITPLENIVSPALKNQRLAPMMAWLCLA